MNNHLACQDPGQSVCGQQIRKTELFKISEIFEDLSTPSLSRSKVGLIVVLIFGDKLDEI
jgi:hypothetical protein